MGRRMLGVGVAVLGVGIAVWLGWEQGLPSATPTQEPGTPGATVKRWSTALRVPTPPRGGSLSIQGWVRDERGPVAGVRVSATRPMPDETLSELKCPETPSGGVGPKPGDPRLPDCMRRAEPLIVDHVSARYGEAPLYAEATTGEDGSFVLEGLPEGTFMLWALGERGAKQQPDVVAGTEGVELVLGEGVTLEGVVTDAEGRPLPEVRLTFMHEGHTRFFDTLTGADGEYRIGPLPKDGYALVAEKEGWLPRYLEPSVLSWRQGREVVLFRPNHLWGLVLSNGAPAPGVEVRLTSLERDGFEEQVAATDAEGRFTFESLGPGEYRLMAASQERYAIEERELGDRSVKPVEVVLNLGEARYVEGTVQDASGRTIGGASVELRPEGEYGKSWKTITDAQGHYRLGPVVAGAYSFDVSASRYVDLENADQELTADTGPVDFTLQPAAVLAGVLVDEEGQPVPGARVALDPPPGQTEEVDVSASMARSDDAGRFSMDTPRMGEWLLRVSDEKFLSREVRVQAPAENLRLVLSRGATVVSTLTDESGAPVEGSWVVLWKADERGSPERGERTDERGLVTLQGIEPGRYVLEAALDHKGVDRRAAKHLEVRGSEQLQVELSFEEGWTLSGIVVDGEGKPIPGASIRAEPPREALPAWRARSRGCGNRRTNDAYTGPDGRFTVKHLVGEVFEVYVWADGFTFNPGRSTGGELMRDRILRVREGSADVRLVLDRHGCVRGRVVGPDGSPLRRFNVNGDTVSGESGAFEVPFDDSGDVRLEFDAPGLAPLLRTVQVRQWSDVELGEVRMGKGRRITGRVMDAETGAPVARAQVGIRDPTAGGAEVSFSSDLRTQTQEDGGFELAQVEPRALTLTVEHEGYLEAHIPLGVGTETVPVVLDPGARVEATLRDAQGLPLEGEVALLREGQLRQESIDVRQGRGLGRGIVPGVYLARASVSKEDDDGSFEAQWVTIPERGSVVLSFTQQRAGVTLKLRQEGEGEQLDAMVLPGTLPLPLTGDEAIGLWRFAGVRSEQVEQEGAWTFLNLPPGKARLLVLSYSPRIRYHLEELELPETGVVERVIRPAWRPLPLK